MHGTPINLYDVADTVVDVRLSPASIIGGTVNNISEEDGYLVFFDKPAAEVILGTTLPYYFVSCFGLSVAPLCRAGEGIAFANAMSIAMVNDIPDGSTARTAHVTVVIQ